MSTAQSFSKFCKEVSVSDRETIRNRRYYISRAVNKAFRGTEAGNVNSLYVGSFGRGTASSLTSDVDLLVELPIATFSRFNELSGNKQSALLQAVKTAIRATYSSTELGGDGQVVVAEFADGTVFEVLPAFLVEGEYLFPDSNGGGSWRVTNPRPEIAAMDARNTSCKDNLRMLCRMMRAWKATWNVPISGMLIDTLAYNFLATYEHREQSYTYYDYMARDFFLFLYTRDSDQKYWTAPGSSKHVYRSGAFEYRAGQAWRLAKETDAIDSGTYSYRSKWREIFGSKFPVVL